MRDRLKQAGNACGGHWNGIEPSIDDRAGCQPEDRLSTRLAPRRPNSYPVALATTVPPPGRMGSESKRGDSQS
jgi:hypothetical protein